MNLYRLLTSWQIGKELNQALRFWRPAHRHLMLPTRSPILLLPARVGGKGLGMFARFDGKADSSDNVPV